MDGKNSVGRRISLLNDDALPELEPGPSSRTSSSSPCLSPQTPQLLRSASADSAAMNTPSPVTPTFGYYDAHSPTVAQMPYFLAAAHAQKDLLPAYPLVAQPYAHAAADHAFRRPPGTERRPMPPANPKTKKNQYPCPLALKYNCNDHFTTSGHAARHAKKHTGKKDAVCPDCHKAFTRKDNMEQHRRTHQNGRNARASPKDGDEGRAKKMKQNGRPRPSPIQSSQPPSAMSPLDPSLPVSPASSYGVASAAPPVDEFVASPFVDAMSYPPPEKFQLNPPTNGTYGLEALALACGEKRKFDA